MNYNPQVGDNITLNLPDERTRATLVRLVSKDTGIAELLTYTTASKSHNYRKGDLVPCRFGRTVTGLDGWVAIPESELEKRAKPEEVPPEKNYVRPMVDADIFGPKERKAKGKSNAATAG